MKQYYRIADLNIIMDTFGRTAKQAEKYICEPFDQPDLIIQSNVGKVKKKFPFLSDEDCEYKSTSFRFKVNLINYNGIVLHSSAVVVDGKAYLFTADPGTGKSTHTTRWLQLFGERAFVLNDDKPALRLVDGVWYAYGTPWSGKDDISVNTCVPLAGIAALERGERNEISRFDGFAAIHALFKQLVPPMDTEYRTKVLDHMDKLISMVPIWKLKCNMDPEAAIVSYEAMSGQKYEKGE